MFQSYLRKTQLIDNEDTDSRQCSQMSSNNNIMMPEVVADNRMSYPAQNRNDNGDQRSQLLVRQHDTGITGQNLSFSAIGGLALESHMDSEES